MNRAEMWRLQAAMPGIKDCDADKGACGKPAVIVVLKRGYTAARCEAHLEPFATGASYAEWRAKGWVYRVGGEE